MINNSRVQTEEAKIVIREVPVVASKPLIVLQISALIVLAFFAFAPKASAQDVLSYEASEEVGMNKAELSELLAPIALYPDALLSQILVASTYPLEIVQANRWRASNSYMSEDEVIKAVADMDWDPSVKALAPYEDLLARITDDLGWLQNLGNAFLSDEDLVLESVQSLRQAARESGSIADNDYYEVVEDDNNIVIESTKREIVYVPYYDSRVVYGSHYWSGYQPVYWDRPLGYTHLHGGFYWNSRSYVRPSLFFGGFHWGNRNLVVDHYYYDRPYSSSYYYYPNYYSNRYGSSYRVWNHDPFHRRGVRYPQKVVKTYNNVASRNYSNIKMQTTVNSPTTRVIQRSSSSYPSVSNTQQKLNNAARNQNTRTTTRQSSSIRPDSNTARVLNRQPSSSVIKQQSTPRPSITRQSTNRSVSTTQRRTTTTANTSRSSTGVSAAAKTPTGNNPFSSRSRQRLQTK